MRKYTSDPAPWHFVPVQTVDQARVRRWNIIIISFLAFLLTGLFLTATLPSSGGSSSAASKVPPKIHKAPVAQHP